MFQNYFKTAIRSILRERYYALIKIAGLALGLGTTMVIFLYVSHELSFDNFHKDIDRLYCVTQSNIWDHKEGGIMNSTGPAVAFNLASEFPEIELILRINTPGGQIIRYAKPDGDLIAINEEKVLAADSTFFSFFDFKLKEGDPKTALTGIGKVVLSDVAAKRLFGDERALGKIIMVGDTRIPAEVTGVTEEQPTNAHFHFDYLLSMYTNPFIKEFEWSWIWTQVVTYVKLRPDADPLALDEKLKTFADRHAVPTFQRLNMDYTSFVNERGAWKLYIQPVKEIHLQSYKTGNRLGPEGDIRYIYIFSAIGIFILLIAVINFVNLSTARASKRAKEIGVKKTLGVLRKSLIMQFQVEHIIMTFGATLLALGVMEILRLLIQPIVGIEIPVTAVDGMLLTLLIVVTPVIVGFLAGLYPAFYLTSFQPVQVLKGKLSTGFKSSSFRNVLVVFQFTISIVLMVATLIVFQQLEFYRTKDIGFDKDNLIVINHADKLGQQLESFREEVSRYPGVTSASISMDIREGFEDIFLRESDDQKFSLSCYKIEEHFFETTKMSIVAGRTFDKNRPSDKNAVILTETTCRLLGWQPEEAIGKGLRYLGDDVPTQEIVGVAKDVHLQPLRQSIYPFIFFRIDSDMYGPDRIALIKYNTTNVTALLNRIENRWKQLSEGTPMTYAFYDESLKQQYVPEHRLGSMFFIFTGLSITIAIMGLVGLVSYSAEQRKKEIGIRKVFGASLSGIYIMINKEYVRLMIIALVVAVPVSWFIMQQWLSSIPEHNRIAINPVVFILAFAVELVLALVCVGYLAIRAASVNPATVLKEE
jgi:putative ABC transport system permease protein